MPAAAPFKNPKMLHAFFTYDPDTGKLHPKEGADIARKLGMPVIKRTNNTQYRVEGYARSHHRIIWAMHHPEDPNPRYIRFLDGNKDNTRIENMMGTDVSRRWEGYIPRAPMCQLPNGKMVQPEHYTDALAEYEAEQRRANEQSAAAMRERFVKRLSVHKAEEEAELNAKLDAYDWDFKDLLGKK